MADRVLTHVRGHLAFDAAFEITMLAHALRKIVDDENPGGQLVPVSRGICMRIVTLSEVITTAIESNLGDASTSDKLARIIGCEVRHVLRRVETADGPLESGASAVPR